MKTFIKIISGMAGIVIAILSFNAATVSKQKKNIKKLEKEKQDLEIKEAVLIESAANAKKKTIKSKEELDEAIEKINRVERPHFNDPAKFLEYLRKSG